MIALNELIACRVEEVLSTPSLRDAVKKYTSQLFYSGGLIKTCESSIKLYFRRLQLEGVETQKKQDMAKYILSKDVVITFSGQVYNSNTITDEIAEQVIERFPKLAGHFKIKEEPKQEGQESSVKKITRKKK